ncbi:MAG: potassium-transporting ATPase subunit F [Steroidobacteraceae bacterium]
MALLVYLVAALIRAEDL